MNMKINTICFIFLFLFLVCTVSAAKSENETEIIAQVDCNHSLCKISDKYERLEATCEKQTLEKAKATKKKVTLKAPSIRMRYKDGTPFKVTLTDKGKKAIGNAKLKIALNGATYSGKTDRKGVALFGINLKSGTYTLVTTFEGNKDFEKASVKSTVTVKSTIKCGDMKKYYKNAAAYTSTFCDKKGKVLKETPVKFKLNGKTHTVKTNKKGVAKLAVNLKPGKYSISSINTKTSETVVKTVTVKTLIETKDLTMKDGDGSSFRVKVLNSNGKAAANRKVTVKISGKTYARTTDKNGIASLPIDLDVGKYTITTEYDGLKSTNTITVNAVVKHTPFSHVIRIDNYVNVTTPYVFHNSAYALKTGFDGIIRMSKNELITVQVSETQSYMFSQAEIPGLSTTVIGYMTHLIPFDGGAIRSDYIRENLKGDGILISSDANHTSIEFRSHSETNADMFGVYMDRGSGYSEKITYVQNSHIRAMIGYETYSFDETGLRYNLAKFHGKSIYDFGYRSYEELIGDAVNTIRFAKTGEPVTFSYFGNSIVGYLSREDITTQFILNGVEELSKGESISYGLSDKYRPTAGFEVLQAYAIINEKITRARLEGWLSAGTAYLSRPGIMNVYGMYMAGLETAWLADESANQHARDYSVEWKRARTAAILGGINLDDTYLHILNADMGMKVTGNAKNAALFRFINSVNLPNIEEYVLTPVGERYGDNALNSLNNVFSAATGNFSMAQLGDMLYVFSGNDSAAALNTTSGICSVILRHGNETYKGSGISTRCDCCSVAMTAKDITKAIIDTMKTSSPVLYHLTDSFKKIHPFTTMAYNVAKFLLSSTLTGAAAVANGLLSTMLLIQATGTTYREKMIDEKSWHAVMDTVTFTRPGYLQSKKIYNIPNSRGGTDYIEVRINDDLSLNRTNAKYITSGKTKVLSEAETYRYFCEDYWTPFSMPAKYWDKSWQGI